MADFSEVRVHITVVMGLLEGAMAISYGLERQWLLAITWTGYTIAVVALGLVNQR